MGIGYGTNWNNNQLREYTQAYRDLTDNDPQTNSYMNFFPPTTSESELDKSSLHNMPRWALPALHGRCLRRRFPLSFRHLAQRVDGRGSDNAAGPLRPATRIRAKLGIQFLTSHPFTFHRHEETVYNNPMRAGRHVRHGQERGQAQRA